MTNRRHSQHSPGGGRNQPGGRRFSIKGSNPSPYAIAYDLRRTGRRFSRNIHKSVSLCGTGVGTLRTYESDDGPKATVSARHNCHSAWACPVCSPKIAAARQKALAPQVVRLIERGYTAHLATLTIRHNRGHDLDELFDAMGRAWGKLASGKAWRNWRNVGSLAVEYVRGLDLTWSLRNGWHPHLHVPLYLPPGHSGDVEWFIERWIKCLEAEGFHVLREAQDVGQAITLETAKEAEKIAAYAGMTAAMPTAEAIGMAMKKKRDEGSFTPFEMLAKAAAGDAFFEHRWKDYVKATKGRRQVTVSRGLKLSDDKDLALADDVATLGPEAKDEAECSGMIPALLSAARCVDLDERRVSVASVLSRLEATDWRIIERDEPKPPKDTRERRARSLHQANIRPHHVEGYSVHGGKWRKMKRNENGDGWCIDRDAPLEEIRPLVRAMMPRGATAVVLLSDGAWQWTLTGPIPPRHDPLNGRPRCEPPKRRVKERGADGIWREVRPVQKPVLTPRIKTIKATAPVPRRRISERGPDGRWRLVVSKRDAVRRRLPPVRPSGPPVV